MRWVFKLGGSLMESGHLAGWLAMLAGSRDQEILIVPGGGLFADLVRQVDSRFSLGERASHEMAILATQQYGLMMSAIQRGIGVMDCDCLPHWQTGQTAIWLPQARLLDQWGLGCGWDFTSDSIAAVAARQLAADQLVLVKSCALPEGQQPLSQLASSGIVDSRFGESAGDLRCQCWLAEKDSYGDLKKALREGNPERYCNTQIDLTN